MILSYDQPWDNSAPVAAIFGIWFFSPPHFLGRLWLPCLESRYYLPLRLAGPGLGQTGPAPPTTWAGPGLCQARLLLPPSWAGPKLDRARRLPLPTRARPGPGRAQPLPHPPRPGLGQAGPGPSPHSPKPGLGRTVHAASPHGKSQWETTRFVMSIHLLATDWNNCAICMRIRQASDLQCV